MGVECPDQVFKVGAGRCRELHHRHLSPLFRLELTAECTGPAADVVMEVHAVELLWEVRRKGLSDCFR